MICLSPLSAYRTDYQDFIYLERLATQIDGRDSYAYRQQDAELEGFEISLQHETTWRWAKDAKLVNEIGFSQLRGTRDDGARCGPFLPKNWFGTRIWIGPASA